MNSKQASPFYIVNNATQLVPTGEFGVAKYVTDDLFDDIVKGGYLPRLQLFSGASDAVKEEKIPMNHFGLVHAKDQIDNLGKEVNFIPLSFRLKALRLGDGQVVAHFNPNSAEFKAVVDEAQQPNSKCMYGPEFLIWIPQVKVFATLMFGSKTSRKEGRNVRPLIGNGCTLTSKLFVSPEYKWMSPVAIKCSAPLDPPPMDKAKEEVQKFNNPSESSVEFNPVAETNGAAAGATDPNARVM